MQNIGKNEAVVKCSLCGDMWHTTAKIGEMEACAYCDDVFYVQPEDVMERGENYCLSCGDTLSGEVYRDDLGEFMECKECGATSDIGGECHDNA